MITKHEFYAPNLIRAAAEAARYIHRKLNARFGKLLRNRQLTFKAVVATWQLNHRGCPRSNPENSVADKDQYL